MHIIRGEIKHSGIPIIALSFLSPKSRPSAQAARNPDSTMSEIVVVLSTLRSRDGTMKYEVVRMARDCVARSALTHSRLH